MDLKTLRKSIFEQFPTSVLEPVSKTQLAAIAREHPNVPTSYLDFLSEVGAGRIGKMGLAIYNGLCEPEEFFDRVVVEGLAGMLLFGDDFAGWHVGFDTRQEWRIVSLESYSAPRRLIAYSRKRQASVNSWKDGFGIGEYWAYNSKRLELNHARRRIG